MCTHAIRRRCGGLMMELLNPRNQIILSVLCVGFILVTRVCSVDAAELRDIRVGEYGTHTRIVFEYGGTIPHETLRSRASGQLFVGLPDTELDLKRKIPIVPSRNLKEIKIHQRRNELYLLLTFAYDHFRYELSQIDQPKRLILDVYRVATAETTSFSETAGKAVASAPDREDGPPDRTKDLNQQPSDLLKANEAPDRQPPTPETVAPAQTAKSEPAHGQTPVPPLQPAARAGRMQHYLVIGLVILTLAILVLLLTMLILKNNWAKPEPSFKSDDILKLKDDRIATIDAKLEEQLEYDNRQ
jgi:hypothetical protein